MAVPKRRKGRAKVNSRRSSHSISAIKSQECPQCHEPKLPHHVCSTCGYYDGKEIIEIEK
ncbi:MAG: 50S ribosomal protein L32 [Actinomycetes bacterium]|jgi:large subunit ribosomal protein L32|nr:50S ribosomal protein L32 [Actinomycetes bacterium]